MSLLRKLRPDPLLDAMNILGVAAVVWGIWQINHAAAWITAGLALIGYSFLVSAGRRHIES